MLLRVYLEDTLPFVQSGKGNTLVNWTVNETLPLSHPSQLASLAKELGIAPNDFSQQQIDPKNFSLMHGSDSVDTSLTPGAAMLVSGTVLTMIAKSNTPRTMRQTSGGDSPRGSVVKRASFSQNNANNTSVEDSSTPPRSPAYNNDDGSPSEYPDDETMSQSGYERDEVYVSEECGWFPFHLNSNYGQLPVATCIDPIQASKETDRNPPQQQLCPPCSQLLSQCASLKVPVDRHYKPMSLNYDISEGWVEKLSLGRFARWQKRYIMLSERSVDWFIDQPTPGDKAKIRGTRHVMRDGVVNISDIIEQPDPNLYPKCKDTNYVHFGIVFKHPATTLFFRTPSPAHRTKHVTFLKQMVTRLTNTGAQKDPVYWKKWSDALLTNLADLGEVTTTNRIEKERIERELGEISVRRKEIKDELPGLQQVLSQQRNSVQNLKKELANIETTIAQLDKEAKAEEDKIEIEKIELSLLEIEIGDELRKAEVLRAYAQSQKDEASARIETLNSSIAELKQKHTELFTKWRKLEEQSTRADSVAAAASAAMQGKQRASPSNLLSFSANGIPLSQSVKRLPPEWKASLNDSFKSNSPSLSNFSPNPRRI